MFGGGEVWLFRTMRELEKRGHQTYLLCRPGVILDKKAREKGFTVHTLAMRGDLDPVTIMRTWRLLRRLKPHVVCTNMDKELRFGGLAARLAGVPVVVPRRGIDYPLKNKPLYRLTYQKLASGVIANSEATKASLLSRAPWLRPDKIRVIYNGINPEDFSSPAKTDLRGEFGIDPNTVLIGFVGQLDERKGVDTLIKAFSKLARERTDIHLLLTGTGPLRSRLEELSRPFRTRISFAGYRDDPAEIMKAVDMLILPSLWEGFGIVLIEAMAAGKPVISTNVSNIPEIVSDNKEGLLINPGDEHSLTTCMRLLCRDRDLRQRLGKAGKRKVTRLFTLEHMVDEVEEYFSILMEKSLNFSENFLSD